ncbi:MAG: HNH endonuclease signature motif containing protein, partial [Dermatophilaceae bacterium]
SSTDWLLQSCFQLEPADAARTVDLARLCRLPKNQVLAAAVSGGTVTVRKAMTALRQLAQVEHSLTPGKREGALGSLTLMARAGYDRHVIAIGRTLDGQVLSPEAVCKLACDASIISMVLGSQGQPLDVGRTKRLVTSALLAALWIRDKGCTFSSCGRPPRWSDAHHVRHWADGGPTALLNLALLCQYHPSPRSAGGPPRRSTNTTVHQHDSVGESR